MWGLSDAPERIARRPKGLLPRLGLLAAVTLAPVIVGIAYLAQRHIQTIGQATDSLLDRIAIAGSQAIQAEIARLMTGLSTLAIAPQTSPFLTEPEDLHRLVRRAAAVLGTPISVIDRTLGVIADSEMPFGTPLPSTPAANTALQVLESGRAAVGDLLSGETPSVAVMVPVTQGDRVIAAIAARVDLARLEERFATLAGSRALLLLDGQGRLLVGLGGVPGAAMAVDARSLLTAAEGRAFEATISNIGPQRIVVRRLPGEGGWIIAAALPVSILEDAELSALIPALFAAGIALFFGSAGAVLLTGRLRRPIIALADHARAVAQAGDAPLPDPPLALATAEFESLRLQMLFATAALSARERRHRALAETGALITWRADAGGALTEAAGWQSLTGQAEAAAHGDGWLAVVHPDDRAPALAGWGRCLVARAPINVEYRMRAADDPKAWRWVRTTGVPVLDGAGRVTDWYGTIRDVGDRRGAIEARATNEDQVRQTLAELRAVYDSVPVGLALVDPDLRFLNINARVSAISGLPTGSHIGRTAADVLPAGVAEPLMLAQRRVLESGRPVLDIACAGESPGTMRNTRHWLASCHPVTNSEGKVTGVSAVLQDVTERVRAEQSRELLVRELNHRVKNTLATVQSIASQTLRGSAGDPQRFGQDFVARLQALSRAHDLLTAHAWLEADFAEVVPAALAPWLGEGRRLHIDGPGGLMLRPTQAQAVMLALNELATNAAKYGALSKPSGRVQASWATTPDDVITFDWVESGGPLVVAPPPERRGFGTRLLVRALAQDLGTDAAVTLRFDPSGLRAQIRFRALHAAVPAAAAQ